MKVLDTSNITDSKRLPIKKSVLDYIQESYRETTQEIIKSLCGTYDPNQVYILNGISKNGNDYSAGSIFYNGYMYTFSAQTITGTVYFVTSNHTDEVITYTDGNSYPTLINKIVTLSNSGTLAYGSAIDLSKVYVRTTDVNQTILGIKTFNSSPIVPAPTTDTQASNKKYVDDSLKGKILAAGSVAVSTSNQSHTTPISGLGLSTSNYVVSLSIRDASDDPITINFKNTTTNGFDVYTYKVNGAGSQSFYIDYIVIAL